MNIYVVFMASEDSLLERILNLRGNKFSIIAIIKFLTFLNVQ